jgi:hypothetical protein
MIASPSRERLEVALVRQSEFAAGLVLEAEVEAPVTAG